jgi:hypothetical protein
VVREQFAIGVEHRLFQDHSFIEISEDGDTVECGFSPSIVELSIIENRNESPN